MKRDATKALLKYLSASFPNQLKFPVGDKDRDKMVVETWHDWLKQVDVKTAKVAVKQAAFDNPRWVPSPASILKAVQQLENDYPTPTEAWKIAREKKFYKDRNEVPKIVQKAIKTYDGYFTGKENEISFLRKEFIQTYKEVLKTEQRESGLENYLTDGQEVKKLTEKIGGNQDV